MNKARADMGPQGGLQRQKSSPATGSQRMPTPPASAVQPANSKQQQSKASLAG